MIKALRKLTSLKSLDEVSRFASDIVEAWNSLAKDRFLTRKTITATLNGSTVLAHNLGYVPVGYIVTSQNAVANFYLTSATTTTITLVASASVTATIEVF